LFYKVQNHYICEILIAKYMKAKNFLCGLVILFFFNDIYSQGNKSDYREYFTQGNLLILEQNYPLALKYFLDAYKIDSTNANINYKVGFCYLQSANDKNKALPYLEKAVQDINRNYKDMEPREKGAPEMALYYLGTAYRLAYKFNESNTYFNRFQEIVGHKNKELAADLTKQVETNFNAAEFTKDTAAVTIVNLGDSVNSSYPDYSPVVSADESTLIFTSRRPGSTGGDKTENDQFYEDIYISNKGKDGNWSSPKPININTNDNEANIGLSPDGQQLFVYRSINGGDIYYSNLEGETWGPLIAMDANVNSPAWETHATQSVDGNTLYFVSDRKEGGLGGRDIWRCVKLPNGKWSMPLNLGPTINTPFDEDAPFIHPDGVTLFFSSTGHKTMGGFDVFKSVKDDEGKWSTPENLKAPINTPDDDIFYMQSVNGKRGYLSSVRPNGKGEKDLYVVNFEQAISEPLTLLRGYLTFDGTTKIPDNVMIMATDMESGLVVQDVRPNSVTGKYILILNPGDAGKTYTISYEAEGYQPISETITIPPNSAYQEIDKELSLKGINFESKVLGTISVAGTIINQEQKIIPGAKIIVKDNTSGKLIDTYFTTSDSGSYYFVLNRGQNYNISYEADGYLFQSENVNVPKQPEYSALTKNIVLEKVAAGAKIILNNIFFDSNKATLRKESNLEIEKVLKLMKDYPDLKIEVAGHTDSKGNDAANLKLSQMRSQSVVEALSKKGIDKSRLVAKGYGETMPVAPNVLPNGKPDLKGMQLNRRVELKILESNKQ
jgi:outer membrane protein OmpA-like peptidoglycan-associated protein/tetratricopeptide (TPR) repeat protein